MDLVIFRVNSPSLRGLLQFGLNINYSTLKNYYNESRLMSISLFEEFLEVSKIKKEEIAFEIVKSNWGQVKGGKIGKRKKFKGLNFSKSR